MKDIIYLSRVHVVKLVPMEVDVEAQVFAGLQDGASGAEVEHSLLAEHVDVVDSEAPRRPELFQPGQLNPQDVLCGLCNRLPSEEEQTLL